MENEPIDSHDMRSLLKDFFKQVEEGFNLPGNLRAEGKIKKIFITGMGGSALPGEIMKSYLDSKIPLFVNKDYNLPAHADSGSLVFAISYSGDTEETINAYRDAIRKGCSIIVLSSGGKLDILAKKNSHPLISIPKGLPPRMSYGILFFSILRVLNNSELITGAEDEVRSLSTILKSDVFMNKGEELAELLVGKIPLIYTSEKLHAAGYKWKINFNENAKIHAFSNVFPEMNHNEIMGYTNILGDYHVLILKNDDDNNRVQIRMEATKKIIKNKGVPVTEIGITGPSLLSKLFSAIYIGDWVSYFLAIKNKTDPWPVKIIEEFKQSIR